MNRILKAPLFWVLSFKNLWALDITLFYVLAIEALRPRFVLQTLSDPQLLLTTLFSLSLIWFGRVILLWIQKKTLSGYFESGLGGVILAVIFLLGLVVAHFGRLNLGEFLPLLFLFMSAFAMIYRNDGSQVYWRLIPMTATALGFVLAYLRPENINPVPVSACLLGGASHWFISKYKTTDSVITALRVYFITVVALLTARLIYCN
jgi:hypothetical protein